jgi:undecaprenyl diphosphate synthase
MDVKEKIDKTKLPQHIAVIMDGNGRWAKKKGNQRIFGHKNGINAVRETVEAAAELGIKFLTLYAFSTENWKRPKAEVNALMHLLISSLNAEIKTLQKNNVRLLTIGDTDSLPKNVAKQLRDTISKTEKNKGLKLVLALSYSGRWEITQAVKKIAELAKTNKIAIENIDEDFITKNLQGGFMPGPELLIRTSGEYRISNFLLWQIAYTELYFTDVLWPDFRKENLYQAIDDFQKRERRFGKTSEQLENTGTRC